MQHIHQEEKKVRDEEKLAERLLMHKMLYITRTHELGERSFIYKNYTKRGIKTKKGIYYY